MINFMTPEEYDTWKGMELTKKAFKLWEDFLKWQNKELVEGRCLGTNEHHSNVNYYSIIGYNKFFNDLNDFTYKQLVGENEDEQNTSAETETTNSNSN